MYLFIFWHELGLMRPSERLRYPYFVLGPNVVFYSFLLWKSLRLGVLSLFPTMNLKIFDQGSQFDFQTITIQYTEVISGHLPFLHMFRK